MSKIIELAQAIDNEISDLRHSVDYLLNKLSKEKERRKKYLNLMQEVLEQYKEEETDDYA